MSVAPKSGHPATFAAPLFTEFAEMPYWNAHMLTRANEIVSEVANAIWAGEVELARLETEEGVKLLSLARPAGDPGELATERFAQWHNSSEKIFAQMCEMGSAMRRCSWDLFELYAENMRRPAKSASNG